MKSRKKTNNKLHIVIAFGTGIAAARSLEAAMLFSRAGFDIHPIFLKDAENWLGAEAVRQVCNHSIACCENLPDSPKWFVPTWKGYDLAIVFEPDETELNSLINLNTELKSINHITSLAKNIIICGSMEKPQSMIGNFNSTYFSFPKNQGLYSNFFYDLFAYASNLLYEKKEKLSYNISKANQGYKWFEQLAESMKAHSICQSEKDFDIQIDNALENSFDITLSNGLNFSATIENQGIIIKHGNIKRFLPTITEQSAFDRLVKFIIIEQTKITQTNASIASEN